MIQFSQKAKTIRHMIYSSSAECQIDHGIPHWETSWKITEQYLQTSLEDDSAFRYHVLRHAHCNKNIVGF